jgi:hypothetical protein
VVVVEAKAARVVTVFNEIAPGVFVRAIQQPPIARPRARALLESETRSRSTSRAAQTVHFAAENDTSHARALNSRDLGRPDEFGELIATALHVQNTMEGVAAVVRSSVRSELKRAEVHAREFDRQIKEVRRCLRIR